MYNPYQQPNPYQQQSFGPSMPYPQPYAQPYQQPQMPPQAKPTFDFVNGIEGAKSFAVAPNRTAILMDTENAACYIKTANGIGQCFIDFYALSKTTEEGIRAQRQKAETANFVTKGELASIVDRLVAIEKAIAPREEKKQEEAK